MNYWNFSFFLKLCYFGILMKKGFQQSDVNNNKRNLDCGSFLNSYVIFFLLQSCDIHFFLTSSCCALRSIPFLIHCTSIENYLGLFTDLGSLIGNTQRSSFFCHSDLTWISILVILKPQKLPIWPFEQLWILGNFWHFQVCNSSKN